MSQYIPTSGSSTTSTLMLASGIACAYHGYKRNNSVLWAVIWGALGRLSYITPVVAVAQGFGKSKGK